MKVVLQKSLVQLPPQEADVTIVYDLLGNPIAVCIQQSPATLLASVRGLPDFEELLDMAGYKSFGDTTITPIQQPLSSVRF